MNYLGHGQLVAASKDRIDVVQEWPDFVDSSINVIFAELICDLVSFGFDGPIVVDIGLGKVFSTEKAIFSRVRASKASPERGVKCVTSTESG
jgi:hypothetical protein